MNDRYFVVKLDNGAELDFDKKCNSVDYRDCNYCVFKHDINDKQTMTLGLILHRNIVSIIAKEY